MLLYVCSFCMRIFQDSATELKFTFISQNRESFQLVLFEQMGEVVHNLFQDVCMFA